MSYQKLAESIQNQLLETSTEFSRFQNLSEKPCPSGCVQCCLKKDISCSPFELLPMALHLIETNRADEVLNKARDFNEDKCLFITTTDSDRKLGFCEEYEYRPFICRAFGVSARHDKKNEIEFSLCKILNEFYPDQNVLEELKKGDVPFIETLKQRLQVIDPKLQESEVPINKAIVIVLEQVMLWKKFSDQSL